MCPSAPCARFKLRFRWARTPPLSSPLHAKGSRYASRLSSALRRDLTADLNVRRPPRCARSAKSISVARGVALQKLQSDLDDVDRFATYWVRRHAPGIQCSPVRQSNPLHICSCRAGRACPHRRRHAAGWAQGAGSSAHLGRGRGPARHCVVERSRDVTGLSGVGTPDVCFCFPDVLL